jgi:hypothetical protein
MLAVATSESTGSVARWLSPPATWSSSRGRDGSTSRAASRANRKRKSKMPWQAGWRFTIELRPQASAQVDILPG